MFKRVLLCYDGTEVGRRALKRGAELAILLGAQVHVLSIIPSGVANAAVIAGATGHACLVDDSRGYRKLLDESLEWLRARGVVAEGYLATGNNIDQIAAHAKRLAIDLIVLGHYPQPAGGFWWSSPHQKATLAERVGCCIFVAVSAANAP
ncbi:MAG TPA: universal stress protein [Steroidobacteraceae bacterium]|nr:universal stress protein [Steroidobacteraceae bacterium]